MTNYTDGVINLLKEEYNIERSFQENKGAQHKDPKSGEEKYYKETHFQKLGENLEE